MSNLPVGSIVLAAALLASACAGASTGQPKPTTTTVNVTTVAPPSTPAPTAITAKVTTPPCPGNGNTAHRDIAYDSISGVDPNLLSLDVYEPVVDPGCPDPPVMIYVHGGAWVTGDKTQNVTDKITWFNSLGWVLVSVNYRLTPDPAGVDIADLDPARIVYPVHNNDVADAVAWVHDHAERLGFNSNSISIMGHSAGAGIISAPAGWVSTRSDVRCRSTLLPTTSPPVSRTASRRIST